MRHLAQRNLDVQVDLDTSTDDSLKEHLIKQYGLEEKSGCLLMECVLDGEHGSGPATRLAQSVKRGEKQGPRAFALLDLAFM